MKKTLSIILLCLMMLSILPGVVFADEIASGTCGRVTTWRISADGTLTISGNGKMDNYPAAWAPWFDYSDSIKKIVVEEGVENIGEFAFYDLDNVTEAVLPESLTDIGYRVFDDCKRLEKVNIPSSINKIPAGMFMRCESLKEIELHEGITSLETEAFYNTGLVKVKIPSTVVNWETGLFRYCYSLEEVIISEGITYIGESAFAYCRALKNVTYPSSLMYIGPSVFFGTPITTGIIPDGMINSNSLFNNCEEMTSVYIPKSIKSIDAWTFSKCHKLTDVYYGGTEEDWAQINISEYGNDDLNYVTVHYNSGNDKYIGCGRYVYYSDNRFSNYLLSYDGHLILAGQGAGEIRGDSGTRYEEEFQGMVKTILAKEGITSISTYENTETLYLPKSITKLSWANFKASIKDIYYAGTKEQWDELTKDIGGSENIEYIMNNINYHYNWVCEHIMGEGTLIKEADCDSPAIYSAGCSFCLDGVTAPKGEALGHEYTSVVTEPTCLTGGHTTHTCIRCNDSYVDSYKDPKAHEWDDGVYNSSRPEIITYTCGVCDAVKEEPYTLPIITKIDELYEKGVTENDEEAVKALKSEYDALTNEEKAVVTNYAKLEEMVSLFKPAYVTGDINGDNKINALDATQILRFANNKPSALSALDKGEQFGRSDINGDGKINALDATQILRYANNKPSALTK